MKEVKKFDVFGNWIKHMRAGEFEKAWKYSDAALAARKDQPTWHLPRHFQNIWNGESLKDKNLLIRCYHGLGDTIQFIRYAPLIKKLVNKLIVWAQPELIPLLQTIKEIDQLLPLHNGNPEADYNLDIEIMECPHIFRTTIPTIPCSIPYLFSDSLNFVCNSTFRIGLVWKAGPWDEQRNIPFEMLKPLFQIQHCEMHILQGNAINAGWKEGHGFHHGEMPLSQFAKLVKSMDLVITVDSMPAHLAGAMGVPVWNLLHASADWRWMDEIDYSSWYPTMKLFRQKEQGNWQPVIDQVKHELSLFRGKVNPEYERIKQ
jgi:hypothetical protein